MLSKKVFVQGMELLNAFYVYFKLDLDNPLVQQVWYMTFKNLSDAEFESLIQNYMMENSRPPDSPTRLIESMRDKIASKNISGEAAWENILLMLRNKKYQGYNPSSGTIYYIEDMINDITDPALKKTISEMKSQIKDYTNEWVRKEFIENYELNVKQQVKKIISIDFNIKAIDYKK
jgi:hypothetical protein